MAGRFILTAQLKLAGPGSGQIQQIISQINKQLSGVTANINVKVNSTQVNNLTKSLNQTSKAVKQTTNDLENFGAASALAIRRYAAFALTTGAVIGLTRAISTGIDEAVKFDRELVRVAQVTGQSIKSLKGLSDEITRLSTEFGVSSTEILKASVTLSQAGLSAKDVKTSLEALAKTGISATFGSIENTTEATVAIFQQFGVQAKDLESILSSVNKVSAAFAVESDDISVAVRRAGGAFKAAGGNLNEFIALFTSVRQTTRESAESIATGFRTIFTRLQRGSTQKFFKQFGVELQDLEGKFIGPYEAIRRISDALKDLSAQDPRFAQVVEELGGFRQVSKVVPLLTQFGVAEKALSVALRGGNSLTEDAAVAQDALAIKLQKVKEEFADLIRTLVNDKGIRGLVDTTLELSKALVQLAKSITPLIPLLTTFGVISAGSSLGQIGRGFGKKAFGFAGGGFVPGTGNKDTVPSMLTPGEFVLTKKAAQRIGYDRLNKINKFAAGGVVGATAKSLVTNPLSAAIGFSVIQAFSNSLSGADSELNQLTSSLGQLVVRFTLFSSILSAFNRTSVGGKLQSNLAQGLVSSRFGSRFVDKARGSTAVLPSNFQGPLIPGVTSNNLLLTNRQNRLDKASKLRATRTLNRVAGAGLVISAGLGIGGEIVGGIANERINKGQDATRLAGVGGALQGAALGALVGSVIPGIGTALGGLTGAVIGYTTSISGATKQLDDVKFAQKLETLGNELEQFGKGRASASSITNVVSDNLKDAFERFSKGDVDTQRDISSSFKANEQVIEKFFHDVASSSISFEDFNNKTKGSLVTFAVLNKIPFKSLEDAIKKTISAEKEQSNLIKISNQFRDLEITRIQNLVSIMAAFERASQNIEKFANSIEQIVGIASGEALVGVGGSTDVFKRAAAGKIGGEAGLADIRRRGQAIAQTAGIEPGLVNELVNTVQLLNKLPNILNTFAQRAPGFTEEPSPETIGNIAKEFGVSGKAVVNLENAISKLLGNQDQEIKLTDALKEPIQAANKIRSELISIVDIFGEAARTLNEKEQAFIKAYSARADLEQRANDIQLENISRLQDFNDRIKELSGSPTTFRGAVQNLQTRIGTQGVGGRENISGELRRVQAEIARQQGIAGANAEGSPERNAAVKALGEQQSKIQALNKAMSILISDTSVLAAGFRQLDEEAEKNKFKGGLVGSLVFGGVEEKSQLSQTIVNAFRAIQGGIGNVPIDQRRGVEDFLRGAGKTKIGNKTGTEHLEDIVRGQLGAVVAQFGRPAKGQSKADFQAEMKTVTDELVKAFIGNDPTAKQRELITAMEQFIREQNAASNTLKASLTESSQNVEKALINANQQFLKDLRSIFLENQRAELQGKIGGGEGQLEDIRKRLDAVSALRKQFGAGLDVGELLPRASKRVGELSRSADELEKTQGQIGLVKKYRDLIDENLKKQQGLIDNVSSNPQFDTAIKRDTERTGIRASQHAERQRLIAELSGLTGINLDEVSKASGSGKNTNDITSAVTNALTTAINTALLGKSTEGNVQDVRRQASSLQGLIDAVKDVKSTDQLIKSQTDIIKSNDRLELQLKSLEGNLSKVLGVTVKTIKSDVPSDFKPPGVSGTILPKFRDSGEFTPIAENPADIARAARKLRGIGLVQGAKGKDRAARQKAIHDTAIKAKAAREEHKAQIGFQLGLTKEGKEALFGPTDIEGAAKRKAGFDEIRKRVEGKDLQTDVHETLGIVEREKGLLKNRRRLAGARKLAELNNRKDPLAREKRREEFKPDPDKVFSTDLFRGATKLQRESEAKAGVGVKRFSDLTEDPVEASKRRLRERGSWIKSWRDDEEMRMIERQNNDKTEAGRTRSFRGTSTAGGKPLAQNDGLLRSINGITSSMSQVFNTFKDGLVQTFAKLPKLPEQIAVTGTHKVEVIINGAGALAEIKGPMAKMVEESIVKAFDKYRDANNIASNTKSPSGPFYNSNKTGLS